MPVPLDQLMAKVIEHGIDSIEKHEDQDYRKRGCLAGFELCRRITNLEQLEAIIADRNIEANRLIQNKASQEDYWEYRCATAQVEHYYQVLLVAFKQLGLYTGPLFVSKVLLYQRIVTELASQSISH